MFETIIDKSERKLNSIIQVTGDENAPNYQEKLDVIKVFIEVENKKIFLEKNFTFMLTQNYAHYNKQDTDVYNPFPTQ